MCSGSLINSYVQLGSTITEKVFTVKGVYEGKIISPVYFNVYIEGLSELLIESGTGCNINGPVTWQEISLLSLAMWPGHNGQVINNLLYADDSCSISPSPVRL